MPRVYDVVPNRAVLLVIVFAILTFGFWSADWSGDYSYGALMGMLVMSLIYSYQDAEPE